MAQQSAGRIQSPSSINTYRQCPRKYYYLYIERRKTKPSIHLVRGSVVHEALEFFFTKPMALSTGDVRTDLQRHLLTVFSQQWAAHDAEFAELGLPLAELIHYKEESMLMLVNWMNFFWSQIEKDREAGYSFEEAFTRHTPRTEEEYRSVERRVRGFIDVIHERDGQVHIRDYKTSKSDHLSPEYRLQLAIYALLYKDTHGRLPDSVGIFFLKFGERLMEVNDQVLADADLEIRFVHERTQSTDIRDYQKKPGPLCNYCDFYPMCWGQASLTDY